MAKRSSARTAPVVLVREAGHADIPELMRLWQGYMREMAKVIRIWRAPDRKSAEAERKRIGRHFRTGGKAFVCEVAATKELVGMLWVHIEELPPAARIRRSGYVAQVYVRSGFRGRRLAWRMLRAAFAWLKNRRVGWSSLYVMADNEAATRAWKKMGYGFVAHYMGRRI